MSGSTWRKRERAPAAGVRGSCRRKRYVGTPSSSAALAASSTTADAVFLREREHAEDPADTAGGAVVLMDVSADRADGRARRSPRAPSRASVGGGVRVGRSRRRCDASRAGARRCSRSSCPVFGSMQPHVQVVPLHLDALPDPARRRAVVRRLDFDAAIEMHRAVAEAVVAKRLERQRPERRPFLGKHHGDLALRGAVDARVGPVLFPAIEIGLRRLDRLEAQALAAASSACGRCRLRPCPCDRDRRRDTAARRRRSARARRDRAD